MPATQLVQVKAVTVPARQRDLWTRVEDAVAFLPWPSGQMRTAGFFTAGDILLRRAIDFQRPVNKSTVTAGFKQTNADPNGREGPRVRG